MVRRPKSSRCNPLQHLHYSGYAEQKVYSYLGRQAKRKHEQPDLTLIVAGCVAQQEGEALLRRVPELDLVMGPQHANRLKD